MNTREIAKKYRLSHWSQIMQERINRGQSVIEYCAEEKISKNTFFYWQRKLREAAYTSMSKPEEKALVPNGWTKWESAEKIALNKIACAAFVTGTLLLIASCSHQSKTDIPSNIHQTSINDIHYYSFTEPTFNGDPSDDVFFDADMETDYSNITATTEKETYSIKDDYISCIVKNNNPGKAFHVFLVPFLEKFDGSAWVNIPYKDAMLARENGWGLCFVENNITEPNSTMLQLLMKNLDTPLEAGQYRLLVFVGKTKIYAPFVFE